MRQITTILYTSLFFILFLNISTQSSQACNALSLNVQFDNSPRQISWEVFDINQVVLATATYNVTASGNITENICIPDGCYTINFKDSMPTSSYNLIDANGTSIASGGGKQSTDFCISSPLPCNTMSLNIQFDNTPRQISWEIFDANQNVLATQTYNTTTSGSITENICIPDGCYTINFKDNGYTGTFNLTDTNGTTLASGGGKQSTNFCIGNPPCNTMSLNIQFDNTPRQISWEIFDANQNVLATQTYNTITSGNITENICIPDGCYTINFKDNGYTGTFNLTNVNGTTIASGGGRQSTPFCINNNVVSRLANNNNSNTQLLEKDKISVYPTMASDFVNVEFDFDSETKINLAIYDINGKMVDQYMNQTVYANENMELNIANLNRGNYFIKLNSFGNIITKRFVKF